MKRMFVPLQDVELYTVSERKGTVGYHFPDAEGNLVRVNEKGDGKTLQEHLDSIEFFCKLVRDGVKIFPPMVMQYTDCFQELDGFKRLYAMKKSGVVVAECFVAQPHERGLSFNYDGKKMTVKRGGQHFRNFTSPVEYGESFEQGEGCGKIINLFVGDGLKIEYRENIHVHFGPKGRNRWALGRRDFDLLAEAFANG